MTNNHLTIAIVTQVCEAPTYTMSGQTRLSGHSWCTFVALCVSGGGGICVVGTGGERMCGCVGVCVGGCVCVCGCVGGMWMCAWCLCGVCVVFVHMCIHICWLE